MTQNTKQLMFFKDISCRIITASSPFLMKLILSLFGIILYLSSGSWVFALLKGAVAFQYLNAENNYCMEKISRAHTPIRNPAHAFREADKDWTVLVNLDSADAVALNETGMLLWKRINGCSTVGEIIEDVKKQFADMPPGAEEELLTVLETLRDTGLIGFEVKL
jgi:hypothetical protein